MAIANRELDISEQQVTEQAALGLVGTGLTVPVYVVPRPMTLVAAKIAPIGLSGSPAYLLKVTRNTSGGATTITGGATLCTPLTVGTSGPTAVVLAASGSSFLNLAKGDVVVVTSSVANTASFVQVALVVQSLQDIKSHF